MTPSLWDLWLWWGKRKHSLDLTVTSRGSEILLVLLSGGGSGLIYRILDWVTVAETWISLLSSTSAGIYFSALDGWNSKN